MTPGHEHLMALFLGAAVTLLSILFGAWLASRFRFTEEGAIALGSQLREAGVLARRFGKRKPR